MTTPSIDAIPRDVHLLCDLLRKAGFRAWIVGGCTRDLLLGRSVHDWDLTTDARPNDVMRVFKRVIPTGVQHGTVTVMLGNAGYEVTTLRGEGTYSDGRHPDSVTFVSDLHEDLARRDFTMNAIALDPQSGELIDPYGGRDDISARRIRAVGDPSSRFNEDGLRVMRATRFSAVLDFRIDPPTLSAIPTALETLAKVSMERVRDEILKTLAAPRASDALRTMMSVGIMRVICPALVALNGCEQNAYHAYDVWEHTLRCVDACPNDPILRLAALLHDVGKPSVRSIGDKTQDYTFYDHEIVGAKMAEGICLSLRLSNDERKRVVEIVRHHLVVYTDEWTDAAVRRWLRRVSTELVNDVLVMAEADINAKGTDPQEQLDRMARLRARVEQACQSGWALSARDLAINGSDLMRELGLKPGPMIGQVLHHLLERVLDDPAVNERDELLRQAKDFVGGNGTPPPT